MICWSCQINEAAEKIYELLEKHEGETLDDFNPEDFHNWEQMRKRIYAKVINAEMNRELLESVPHRMVMDLAEVYYVKVGMCENDGPGTILVRNEHEKIWGVNENVLHEEAVSNLKTEQTEFASYGASELLKGSTLSSIAEQLRGDFVILPSSVHELIVIREEDWQYSELAEMVREINNTCLSPEEVLSNHVYRYDTVTGKMSIAA